MIQQQPITPTIVQVVPVNETPAQQIGMVEAGGGYFDQDLARLGLGAGVCVRHQAIIGSGIFDGNRLHGLRN